MLHVGGVPDRHRWLSDALALPWHQEHPGSDSRVGPDPARSVIVEALTPKELEVLGHLAELLTTDEIASTMFISVNTVRTHVRSILRKLGASRRNEAIRQAWELDLIPAPLPSVPATVLG
jgi:LuxR family maltose regulon positive regulatory protein